ncbi:tyrosine-type recombinase/integrase [Algibacillus agarilyticus]|uniref:tyrosine-type recombinase/integrase n=1 Tax=Algibacillus agarilyticus TaxID=2234133 RepID=UPI00130060D6|nr:tyrosine-type recombinase/integrase [Algibacillus agarilyticus]
MALTTLPHQTLLLAGSTLSEDERKKAVEYNDRVFKYLPANTQRSYNNAMNCFSIFCSDNVNVTGFSEDFQNNKSTMESYFHYLLHETELSRATIEHRLAVLSTFLKVMEWPNPQYQSKILSQHISVSLNSLRSGIQKQAEPLLCEMLDYINDNLIPDNKLVIRARLLVNLMFDGLLRASEASELKFTDIKSKSNTVFLAKSKTDKRKVGSYRFISNTTIALLEEYKHEFKINEGYILRALSPNQRVQDKPIQYQTVLNDFRLISTLLDLDNPLTAHSARVGGAITMSENGIDPVKIQISGGWTGLSMVERYTRQTKVSKGGMAEAAAKINR